MRGCMKIRMDNTLFLTFSYKVQLCAKSKHNELISSISLSKVRQVVDIFFDKENIEIFLGKNIFIINIIEVHSFIRIKFITLSRKFNKNSFPKGIKFLTKYISITNLYVLVTSYKTSYKIKETID